MGGYSQMNSESKLPYSIIVTICIALFFIRTAEAQSRVSLKDAVEEFNRVASADPIGKSQSRLTVDEILAAIRLIEFRNFDLPVEGRDQYKVIAKEKSIDSIDKLRFINGWGPLEIDGNLYQFEVWWVDLRIERDSIKDRFGRTPSYFNLRIRDRTISSRKFTEAEAEKFRTYKLEFEMLQKKQAEEALRKGRGKM
jgi:hypothetical protein